MAAEAAMPSIGAQSHQRIGSRAIEQGEAAGKTLESGAAI
jgi:hypothetical protein